jgi:hypothetical protein
VHQPALVFGKQFSKQRFFFNQAIELLFFDKNLHKYMELGHEHSFFCNNNKPSLEKQMHQF